MTLRTDHQARIDQLDAQLDEAVSLVLTGLHAIGDEPDLIVNLSAMNVGATLRHHLDQLDDPDMRILAAHAIVRLAQARDEAAS